MGEKIGQKTVSDILNRAIKDFSGKQKFLESAEIFIYNIWNLAKKSEKRKSHE